MLSRKQGRSFPTPDLSAGLALSRQPSHGRRPRLELRNGRNGGNGPHAKSTNRTDLRTALLHSQDADAGATRCGGGGWWEAGTAPFQISDQKAHNQQHSCRLNAESALLKDHCRQLPKLLRVRRAKRPKLGIGSLTRRAPP